MKVLKLAAIPALALAATVATSAFTFAPTALGDTVPGWAGSTSNISSTIQAGSSGTFSFGYEAGTGSYAGSISATSVPSGWTVTSPEFGSTTFTPTLSTDTANINVPAGTPAGVYSVSIYGGFSAPYNTGYGAPGTITDTVTVTAVLLTPLQQWEVSYGNAQNTLITADIAAVQADVNADAFETFPVGASQTADMNKLSADAQNIQDLGAGYPPVQSPFLNSWLGSLFDLAVIHAYPALTFVYLISASNEINASGLEY